MGQDRLNEYSDLINKISISATFTVDKQRVVTGWNDMAAQLTGYGSDEMIGKECTLFADHPCLDKCGLLSEDVPKPIIGRECTIIRKDGKKRIIRKNADYIRDASGNILGGIESFEDTTEQKEAQESLRESEERCRNIVSVVTDYVYTVFIKKGSPVRTVHNSACVVVTGYTEEEFSKDPYLWLDMVPEEDRLKVAEWSAGILKDRKIMPLEHRIIRKDGQVRWTANTPILQYDDNEELIFYYGVIKDITEYKAAHEEAARAGALSAIIEGVPDAILVLKPDGSVDKFNKAFTNNFGYGDEAIGRHIADLFGDINARMVREKLEECLKAGTLKNIETSMSGKDKCCRMAVLVNANLLKDASGDPANIILTITDITQYKEMERELVRALKVKSDFSAMISHEVRTPLGAIKEGICLVLEGIAGDINNKQRELLNIAKNNVERLSRLISQVLDLKKTGIVRHEIQS